jgi:ABC-type multidrug transport system permease subunit
MLGVLLAKDLLRVWRNPLPRLISLALPLCLTGLMGFLAAAISKSGGLGRVRFAIVDEDTSPALAQFLHSAAAQQNKYFEAVLLNREAALRQITDGQLSAVIIVPTNFSHNYLYLTGDQVATLELVKNPSESIHPAVMEEILSVIVTGLNEIARNHFKFQSSAWLSALGKPDDYQQSMAKWLQPHEGSPNLANGAGYENLLRISYQTETPVADTNAPAPGTARPAGPRVSDVLAYLLLGLAAMFLLFMASNNMFDLTRELENRTFERYYACHHDLVPFVAGKVAFAVVMLLLGSLVLLGGGALIFHIHWRQPLALAILTLGYTTFAAALMAVFVALIPDEQRAGSISSIVVWILALGGGCLLPTRQFPGLLRNRVVPLMPTYWFVETARSLQSDQATRWSVTAVELFAASAVLMVLAAFLFRRRFKVGLR